MHTTTLPLQQQQQIKYRKEGAAVLLRYNCPFAYDANAIRLSATDVLAPTTMKNAAKCDTSCELQNLVSHQNFERILHFRLRGSMSVGVSVHPHTFSSPSGVI